MLQVFNLKENKLDSHQTKILYDFFENQRQLNIKYWSKKTIYTVNDNTFQFQNDIYQRKSEKYEFCYEVISNKKPIGQGGFGAVKLIKNTMIPNQNNFFFKKESKKDRSRRVVKIQTLKEDNPPSRGARNSKVGRKIMGMGKSNLTKEYNISKKAGHLAIKAPTIVEYQGEKISFTTMKKIPGETLDTILEKDKNGTNILTLQARLELSRALLQTLKNQVIDKGIIHNDIKPNNILVSLGPPLVVNIIDYGISQNIDALEGHSPLSTPAFTSPEAMKHPSRLSSKSDIFLMGRVIALIWGCSNNSYRVLHNYDYLFSSPRECALKGLFDHVELDDKSETFKDIISNALENMLHLNSDERFSIDDSINAFNNPLLIEEAENLLVDCNKIK